MTPHTIVRSAVDEETVLSISCRGTWSRLMMSIRVGAQGGGAAQVLVNQGSCLIGHCVTHPFQEPKSRCTSLSQCTLQRNGFVWQFLRVQKYLFPFLRENPGRASSSSLYKGRQFHDCQRVGSESVTGRVQCHAPGRTTSSRSFGAQAPRRALGFCPTIYFRRHMSVPLGR